MPLYSNLASNQTLPIYLILTLIITGYLLGLCGIDPWKAVCYNISKWTLRMHASNGCSNAVLTHAANGNIFLRTKNNLIFQIYILLVNLQFSENLQYILDWNILHTQRVLQFSPLSLRLVSPAGWRGRLRCEPAATCLTGGSACWGPEH